MRKSKESRRALKRKMNILRGGKRPRLIPPCKTFRDRTTYCRKQKHQNRRER